MSINTMMLGTLGYRRLRVREPFVVNWDVEDGSHVAEVQAINEFGVGKNQSEALADLQNAIVGLYFVLKERQHDLGTDLTTVWQTLQHMVEEVALS